jgi:hypothetical protein
LRGWLEFASVQGVCCADWTTSPAATASTEPSASSAGRSARSCCCATCPSPSCARASPPLPTGRAILDPHDHLPQPPRSRPAHALLIQRTGSGSPRKTGPSPLSMTVRNRSISGRPVAELAGRTQTVFGLPVAQRLPTGAQGAADANDRDQLPGPPEGGGAVPQTALTPIVTSHYSSGLVTSPRIRQMIASATEDAVMRCSAGTGTMPQSR